MDNSDFEKLVAQCKSPDVDVKIDAVTKLQREFEAGSELLDVDGLVSGLKSCLRTSNQHLTTATLSALPPLFPLLITGSPDSSTASADATTLRNVFAAFLPAGGLIDRLGDSRERVREKARESLVVLGGLAHKCSGPSLQGSVKSKDTGKGQETPLMIWERFVREGGLQSKVWRVREQAILTLVHVRRGHRSFPIRPYLPQLVEALEDTDGTVRECARQSIVELFTGPGVTDAARADLKKEMNKKGVRKTIIDAVVLKLLSGDSGSAPQSEGSENGDVPKKDYVPPSLALQGRRSTAVAALGMSRTFSQSTANSLAETTSRPSSRAGNDMPLTPSVDGVEVPTVYVASSKDLESEFAQMLKYFEGRESEHNWAARERSVIQIRGMLKGDAHVRYLDTFLVGLKGGILDATLKALASLRTTLSAHTCSLYTDLAINLGPTLDPFCEALLTPLLRMAGFTKKIVATQSQAVVSTIITHTSPQPRMISNLLWNTLQDKMVQARSFVLNHIKTFLDMHGQRSRHSIESSGALEVLERSVRKGLADANVGVRENARVTFWAFEALWSERGSVIIASLDITARKQLQKVCPDPQEKVIALPSATPRTKKSSVAAAIAASRAKAKAIATAPPSLRHQATAASHAVHATVSPGAQRPVSPAVSIRSAKGIRGSPPNSRPLSPVSPPRRILSISPSRASVSGPVPTIHNRSLSTESSLSPPPSPSADVAHHRRSSFQSNLSLSPGHTLRTALHTALPPSPPRAAGYATPASAQRVVVRRPSAIAAPVISQNRSSLLHTDFAADEEPSLLLATNIPIPDDSDSDRDETNLMSFSAPFEMYAQRTKTAMSGSSTGSPPFSAPKPIVEDALRARAEQAESAAERLLELVEPDDDMLISPIPPSLIRTNGSTPKSIKTVSALNLRTATAPPTTPVNKKSSILRQAALFRDSPSYNGSSSSLMDVLKERKHVTGWWLKRMTLVDKGSPLKEAEPSAKLQGLTRYVTALETGVADVHTLKKLALLCIENPIHDPSSPLSPSLSFPLSPSPLPDSVRVRLLHSNMWTEGRLFDRMVGALIQFLTPEKDEEELEYGLIVIWEMLDNLGSLLEGHEADIFSLLLRVRFCNRVNVLEATNTIRDALTARAEPVYGLTTLHGSLRTFQADPIPFSIDREVKSASYAFGLIALGKFILRLPAEVLEEELPRLKSTLTLALNDASSLVVRESAAASIIASQLVLRDEAHLFTLLDGLADEKKNLLTYLFDKHSARGQLDASGPSGAEKLEREMRRLDGRTNTPPRPKLAAELMDAL